MQKRTPLLCNCSIVSSKFWFSGNFPFILWMKHTYITTMLKIGQCKFCIFYYNEIKADKKIFGFIISNMDMNVRFCITKTINKIFWSFQHCFNTKNLMQEQFIKTVAKTPSNHRKCKDQLQATKQLPYWAVPFGHDCSQNLQRRLEIATKLGLNIEKHYFIKKC